MLLEGYSCNQVANIFNEKDYITCSERKEELKISKYTRNLVTGSKINKRVWTSAAISRITSNELYTGDYVYNKYKDTRIGGRKSILLPEEEWKVILNTHEAIVSREVFDKVGIIKKKEFSGDTQKTEKNLFFLTRFFVKNAVDIWDLDVIVGKRKIQIKCINIEITIVISVKLVELPTMSKKETL